MALITPSTPPEELGLEDHEAYSVTLKKIDWATSSPEYGEERRLQLDWEFETGATTRDWLGLRLGQQQSGQVSKLRALLNALAGKPETTEVKWFNDETFEWGYTAWDPKNPQPYGQLTEGLEVVIRGVNAQKKDGSTRFNIKVYQAARKAAASTTKARPKPAPAPADTEDDIPF